MANLKPENVKRFIENISKDVATKAYENGGGGTTPEDVVDIINDQIKANPEMAGDEPNLEGLEVIGDKYNVPQGQTYTAGNGIAITDNVISLDIAVADEEEF